MCLRILIFAKSFIIHLYFLTSVHHTRINLYHALSVPMFVRVCLNRNAHLMSCTSSSSSNGIGLH